MKLIRPSSGGFRRSIGRCGSGRSQGRINAKTKLATVQLSREKYCLRFSAIRVFFPPCRSARGALAIVTDVELAMRL
jgi:hypothetical protein